MTTGASARQLRSVRRLRRSSHRREVGRFLAEGPRVVREALRSAGVVVEVYATESVGQRHPDLRVGCDRAGVPYREVAEQVLASLVQTVTSQGVVAICNTVDVPLDAVTDRALRLVAVGAAVRDPGNAGTLIRCADAAGADAVVLTGESVDGYNGKCVRASAGSLFHLPLCLAPDAVHTVEVLRRNGLQVLAAEVAGETDLDDAERAGVLEAPTAWLFGNEAHGLPARIAATADARVRVPIYGRAESLNLATAAALCLYASARAHRAGHPGRS